MNYSSLHVHTTFSDGKNTPEETVLEAIRLGMPSLGFSDHGFTEFDQSYCIKREDLGAYRNEIARLKEKYQGQIELYVGLEVDGYTEVEDREAYDFILGDCHYIKTENGYFLVDHSLEGHLYLGDQVFGGDYLAFAKEYYEKYAECMARLKPDALGHFDLITKFSRMAEEDPRYRKAATECLLSCLRHTPVVELNTGAIARGYRTVPYPASFLLKELKAHGGMVALGADSHCNENLIYGFKEAVELLRANGFRSMVALKNGTFQEVAL